MKKHFAIALVLAIMLNTFGECATFIIGRTIIHAEMSSIMENARQNKGYLKLFLSFNDLKSESFKRMNNKEFTFLGQFYDVAAADTVTGGIIFHVIKDEKETILVNKFVKHVSGSIFNFFKRVTRNSGFIYILEKYVEINSSLTSYFSMFFQKFSSLSAFYAPLHAPPELIFKINTQNIF